MDDNFMADFKNFVMQPFTHCTYSECELSISCIHTTFKKLDGDIYNNLNETIEGNCINYSQNLSIKYKYTK